jgi:hypothetical protein
VTHPRHDIAAAPPIVSLILHTHTTTPMVISVSVRPPREITAARRAENRTRETRRDDRPRSRLTRGGAMRRARRAC